MRPVARTDGLVVREIGDETLVYDTRTHSAHCFNRTAALVFRHADGRSVADIAANLARETDSITDESVVRLALEKLTQAPLVQGGPGHAQPTKADPTHGRREALRRVGMGAALLAPVVHHFGAPTARSRRPPRAFPRRHAALRSTASPATPSVRRSAPRKICWAVSDCH